MADRQGFIVRPSRRDQFTMVQPRRSHVVTSSASTKLKEATASRREEWQPKAYELTAEVGEAGYFAHLTANTAMLGGLRPVRWQEDVAEWVPTDDPAVTRVDRALAGPRGGKREIIRRGILHYTIGGESHLVGYPVPVDEGYEPGSNGYLWEFLSTEELRIGASGGGTRKLDGSNVDLPAESYVARWHLADAMFSDRPDSAIRRVMRILEELAVLTQLVEAIAKSRLASGLLFLPNDLAFPASDEAGEPGDPGEPEIDEFTDALVKHMSAPVSDRTSAASIVPLVVTGDGDQGAMIRLIDLVPEGRSDMDWARSLREEAIERLAAGLDAPPEILTGKGGLNHWTGYNIDHDFVIKHVVPKGEDLADFLTVAYLRPMLQEFEGFAEEDAALWGYEFDPTPLFASEDEAATVRLLHSLGLISDETAVLKSGLEVGDMPSADEKRARLTLDLIKAAPVTMGKLLLNTVPGFENVDTSQIGAEEAGPGAPPAALPTEPNQGTGGQEPAPSEAQIIDRLAVAADAIIERALERAGNRVVSLTKQSKADVTIRDRIATLPPGQVLTVLGPADLRALNVSPASLFAGAWDLLHSRSRVWVRTHLEAQGMRAFEADDNASLVANVLCDRVDAYVLDNLHRPLPIFSNGLHISNEVIQEALAAAPAPAT